MHHTFKLEEVIQQKNLQAYPGTRLPLYRNAGLKRTGSDDIIHANTKLKKKSGVEVEVDKEERREKVEEMAELDLKVENNVSKIEVKVSCKQIEKVNKSFMKVRKRLRDSAETPKNQL